MDLIPKLDLVILDCPHALELAHFYSGLLGWPIEDGADQHFATLSAPGGGVTPDNPDGRATLAFQRIDDWTVPTWPGGEHPQQAPSSSCSRWDRDRPHARPRPLSGALLADIEPLRPVYLRVPRRTL